MKFLESKFITRLVFTGTSPGFHYLDYGLCSSDSWTQHDCRLLTGPHTIIQTLLYLCPYDFRDSPQSKFPFTLLLRLTLNWDLYAGLSIKVKLTCPSPNDCSCCRQLKPSDAALWSLDISRWGGATSLSMAQPQQLTGPSHKVEMEGKTGNGEHNCPEQLSRF